MADDDKVANKDGAEEKKGFPMIFVFIGGGMVVLGIVAFILVKFMFAPAAAPEATGEDQHVEDAAGEGGEKKFYGELFAFDQAIIVNLAETNGQRYLKVNLQLEMGKATLAEEMKARTPQLMDLVISILSSKTIEDISSTIGRNRLKREIIDKINAELVTGKIVNIYFTEFVIQ